MVVALAIGGGLYWFSRGQGMADKKNQQVGRGNIMDATVKTTKTSTRYIEYSKENYESSVGKKRVLFFHAVWCPTCKVANEEFNSNPDMIPEDVVLLKTDYDTESELKKKYNITYQHTFILVDDSGNEIKKWNGGGIEELINNTK